MSEPVIALIVAATDNGVIGRDGGMPWHLPADLRHFRRITMGKPVLMGRKTFESIGRPLPGRANVVVTRNPGWGAEGVHVANDAAAALARGRDLALAAGVAEVMVIGGAELYRQLLPDTDRIYLTEIHKVLNGDTMLPSIDWHEWREVSRERHANDAENPCDYSFVTFERDFLTR
ncbi:dihydrofolate reductase [Haliea sp. E17]|uniref:dihydrofolate reductase n=1 Tax=Haliea sp. E17 TaxID=3401576 RepID=UPI003AAF1D1B